MTTEFRAALVQLCSSRSVEANIETTAGLVRKAAASGAKYVQTPEMTTVLDIGRDSLFAASEPEDGNSALAAFAALANDLNIWLHIGSMVVRVGEKLANRAYLFDPSGRIAARYDKIHMFDVDLPNGEQYRESESYEPGERAVVAELPWGKLGFAICYDLRFPHLFRALAHAGARFIAVPAAFTKLTGEAHWMTLLRARAIETQCYVMAAAQGGTHEFGRETFGHSVIISPWGEVLAEGGVDPCVVSAKIDLATIDDVRARVPSLRHDRNFQVTLAPAEVGGTSQ